MKNNSGILVKTPDEIKMMQAGGKKLAKVKRYLMEEIAEGVSAHEIDSLADKLIEDEGGVASFKMVPKYHWATCVNVNEGVVHGIPRAKIIFKKGDLVSVDVGMFYKRFHTDTSFSVKVGEKSDSFLETGKRALKNAIKAAIPEGRIYDISLAIETALKEKGYSPIRALVGHGVGRNLHEQPQIPCFVDNIIREDSPIIPEGTVLAIEVMYAKGNGDVKIANDGWTIVTSDGTISGLFEETVAVIKSGPKILTGSDSNLVQ